MRRKFFPIASTLALSVALMGVGPLGAQNPPAPDNTKTNQRDRSPGAKTADQAKNSTTDRETMQKIRKSLMADKTLSTYAHNVKVISEGGKVTLKGPVRSDAEKQTVEAKATEVAGAGNVVNEITVAPSKSKTK
jgi:osmotically-inducible protein OsmY